MPWCIHRLCSIYSQRCMSSVDGKLYVFAVAEPYTADRLRAAWWVLTGKAYAFEWPKAGDLEAAIGIPLWDRAKANKPTGTQAGT